jgi:hypothetical protein
LLSMLMCWLPFAPWALVSYLGKEVFKFPPFDIRYNRFDLFSIYFLLPIMLLIISATAYGLCLSGFKINYKHKYSKMFYNTFIYNLLNICLAAIYFILVLLFR